MPRGGTWAVALPSECAQMLVGIWFRLYWVFSSFFFFFHYIISGEVIGFRLFWAYSKFRLDLIAYYLLSSIIIQSSVLLYLYLAYRCSSVQRLAGTLSGTTIVLARGVSRRPENKTPPMNQKGFVLDLRRVFAPQHLRYWEQNTPRLQMLRQFDSDNV